MKSLATMAAAMWKDESGISSVEYALLLAFVAGAIVVAAEELSVAVSDEMTDTANCISGNDSSLC